MAPLRLNVSPGCHDLPLMTSAARLMFAPESGANPPVGELADDPLMPSDWIASVVSSAGLSA